MRVKRQKRHRKVVRFYSTCFGFREPYKVLLDGTFVHHLLLHGLAPADSSLSHLLGSRSLLFTTSRCVIGELRSLGESHAAAVDAAKQLITARCEHEKRVSATACIESVIGEENSEHFFVATQDTDLRKKLREVPSVPIIFGLRNSLFIEQPSSQQREFIKSTEEKRLHMSESDFQKIHKRALMGKTAEGSDGDVEEQAARTVSNTARRMLGVAQKSKFKRKKAKRPNPLSCKKKKPKPEVSLPKVQEVKAEVATKRKRIRKRNRVSKDSKPGETET
ncbi:rRNA-processing protein UTP23 homolog isoform X1 [Ananas comosus]|uniref:rRNA-processing protein UTP23 homolog isoform X1 n=1 Tax=Ananas comosus TaxID=4615 RepID=A0A6P5GVI1_ANACO|nr:rRNA-processing protein UTP23 homolog isoform X1 [Ananas comosus]